MAVYVSTPAPGTLLNKIVTNIDANKIKTWRYIELDGDLYFTHSATQWDALMWFKAIMRAGVLVFGTRPPKGKDVSTEAYAVHHGRLIEMLLAHFDKDFSESKATAYVTADDVVRGASAA